MKLEGWTKLGKVTKYSVQHNNGDIILNSDNVTYDDLQTLDENKLIHEHNFVPVTVANAKRLVRCLTCGASYCEICGKVQDNARVAKLIDLGAGDELVWKVDMKENQAEITVSSKR
ncbi:MAG: hypothetical protein WCF23_05475 [Candidatus Nitrosopolaris sp.]